MPTFDEILAYLKDVLGYVDAEAEKLEKIVAEYFPAYIDWLTEKLSGTEPLTMLSVSVAAIFVMVVYIWFRNR